MEFRNEVNEVLAQHASKFDQVSNRVEQVSNTLQQVLTELQAMRVTQSPLTITHEVNPFATAESSQIRGERHDTHLKLSFPKFDGDDPNGWIYKAEQYFDYNGVPDSQQAQVASFHLEGIALQWHRWLIKFRGPLTWTEFTKAALLRFSPTDYDDPSEALTRLRQNLTMATYQEAFERLSQRVDGLPERFLIGSFIAGLRDEIRLEVKIKQPNSLAEAIGVARLMEEKNQIQRRTILPFRSIFATKPGPNPSGGILGPSPSSNVRPTQSAPGPQRITTEEARDRREKGLCYYCDEKFSPGHRCERPQLFMMEDTGEASFDMENGETMPKVPEISFHAIAGTDHPQTLRVLGRLKNKELVVLIDSGNTHNFIDQTIVTRYGLPVIHNKRFQVMVANREKVNCAGMCQGITIDVQGHLITADYFVFPVAACPIVLGVQWLATLGPIETDYSKLTMT